MQFISHFAEQLLWIFHSSWFITDVPCISNVFQYYSQVSEVEAWAQEKLPFVSNEDYGRDETSAQALLRRHETLELEFERYGKKINELRSLCNTLVLEETFDAENVKQRQVVLVHMRDMKMLLGHLFLFLSNHPPFPSFRSLSFQSSFLPSFLSFLYLPFLISLVLSFSHFFSFLHYFPVMFSHFRTLIILWGIWFLVYVAYTFMWLLMRNY